MSGSNNVSDRIEEPTPDEWVAAIARQYLDTIPPEDEWIPDAGALDALLYILTDVRISGKPGDLFVTNDRIGNLPANILDHLYNDAYDGFDVDGFLREMRIFLADPFLHSQTTDKLKRISASSLPESVRKALVSMIIAEGENSTLQRFAAAARVVENQQIAGGHPDIAAILRSYQYPDFEQDTLRQAAVVQFLSTLYPELVHSPELQLVQEIDHIPLSGQSEAECLPVVARKFREITGSTAVQSCENPDFVARMGSQNGSDVGSFHEIANRMIEHLRILLVEKFVRS